MTRRNDGKWCTSRNGTDFDGDFFDTKEEAIVDFRNELKDGSFPKTHELGYFFVGQCFQYSATEFFNSEQIIDMAYELAQDEGGEWAEDYLTDISKEQKEELDNLLLCWIEKHDLNPNFYRIKNSEKVFLNPEANVNKK